MVQRSTGLRLLPKRVQLHLRSGNAYASYMIARVPASSANLGPGFDALAVALELYIEVSIEPSDSFEISSEGYGAGLFDDENHMAAQIATQVLGHSNYKMHVKSGIPPVNGLTWVTDDGKTMPVAVPPGK